MRRYKIPPVFIVLWIVIAIPVLALPEDQQQTIQLQADNSSFDQKNGVIIYTGSAQLTQGSLKIKAAKIIVHYNSDKTIHKIEASGSPAKLEQLPKLNEKIITASAQKIFYLHKSNTVELLENAELTQAGAIMRGHKIHYDLDKEVVRAEGDNIAGPITMTIPANAIKE